MRIEVRRYEPALSGDWEHVVRNAKNAIFQFERGFMEYHADRFEELSAVAYLESHPVAVFPGTIDRASGAVTSHPGLTFGGIVLLRELRADAGLALIDAVLDALAGWGGNALTVKLMPPVFGSYPCGELDYVLWRRGFQLVRRDLSSILPLTNSLPFNSSKAQGVRKARKLGMLVTGGEIGPFHTLLEVVLREQKGIAPVHSRAELELLMERFPERIFVRAAQMEGELFAGVLVFDYGHVWHTQYMVSSARGRETGALDLVIDEVVREASTRGAGYLSFGISTEAAGRTLNEGLLWQKESFGARSITHDFMTGPLGFLHGGGTGS